MDGVKGKDNTPFSSWISVYAFGLAFFGSQS